jgi:MEMO1 family protein
MALPALRNVDAFSVDHAGQHLICLRDPEGIVEDQILLTPTAFFIACHLNGVNDLADVQYAFAKQFAGKILLASEIRAIVSYLDEHGFLYNKRFATLQQQVAANFQTAHTRPAYLAGKSYPAQAAPLSSFLEAFYTRHDGPGQASASSRGAGIPARCLIAPHIDFHRGGHAYAHGYQRFAQYGQPTVVFIFGVAHVSPPVPFVLTKKHFATPFGVLETDQDIVRKLEAVCAWDPYAYEIVHRTEHSIEFQAVMLAYLYGTNVRIVPILCASFGNESETSSRSPSHNKAIAVFLETCRAIITAGPKISVIAGADLAHVGRRFGDAFDINDQVVNAVASRDAEDLQHVLSGNAAGFYRSVMQDHNHRRICGLNCIYAALESVAGTIGAGDLLHYDYAHDPAGGIVSFTNILFI